MRIPPEVAEGGAKALFPDIPKGSDTEDDLCRVVGAGLLLGSQELT